MEAAINSEGSQETQKKKKKKEKIIKEISNVGLKKPNNNHAPFERLLLAEPFLYLNVSKPSPCIISCNDMPTHPQPSTVRSTQA